MIVNSKEDAIKATKIFEALENEEQLTYQGAATNFLNGDVKHYDTIPGEKEEKETKPVVPGSCKYAYQDLYKMGFRFDELTKTEDLVKVAMVKDLDKAMIITMNISNEELKIMRDIGIEIPVVAMISTVTTLSEDLVKKGTEIVGKNSHDEVEVFIITDVSSQQISGYFEDTPNQSVCLPIFLLAAYIKGNKKIVSNLYIRKSIPAV